MNRLIVIGQPGAGKSKLSRRLADITGLPHVALDKLRFKDDGHPIPTEEWIEITEKVIAEDKWILEGLTLHPSIFVYLVPTP
jgi:adenylate kinase family enzyme